MLQEILRNYSGADYYLLEQSQLLKDLLQADLADFTAFDTDFNAAFVTDWQNAIDSAVNYTDDNIIEAQILTQSQAVDSAMKACMEKYMDIIYFAEKAFGKQSPVLKEFGQGDTYRKAGKTQERMFEFMDELNATATKYTTQLQAKGCPPAAITAIPAIRDTLNTTNREQNLSVRNRPVISQGRVVVYNALYAITRQTIDAAQRVYRTNPAKRGQYEYNPPINETDTITRQVTLAPGAVGNIDLTDIEGVEPSPTQVTFKANGSNGKYFATNTLNGVPEPVGGAYNILSGQQTSKTPEQVNADLGLDIPKPFLNVQNTGGAEGTYTVVFEF